jgi:hypothetical protein
MAEPEYLYLPDSPFHTNFQDAVGDSAETYTVYVGIYSITEAFAIDETAKKIPYLRFISVRENDDDQMMYTFPHFECTGETFDSEYTVFMMNLFEQTATNEIPFTPKHILVNGNMALVMFSFEDMAKAEMFSNHAILSLSDSSPVLNMKWAIVDEIVFERNIMGVPFNTKISEFLFEHDSLWNIEYDRVYIDFPFSVYPVGEIDGQLVNINSDVKKNDVYTLHDDYGDRYCFTYKPMGDTNEIIRYAIYTHETKYVVEQTGMEQTGGNEVKVPPAKIEESESEKTPPQKSIEGENSDTLTPDQTVITPSDDQTNTTPSDDQTNTTPSDDQTNTTPSDDQTNTPSMNNEVSGQDTFTPPNDESDKTQKEVLESNTHENEVLESESDILPNDEPDKPPSINNEEVLAPESNPQNEVAESDTHENEVLEPEPDTPPSINNEEVLESESDILPNDEPDKPPSINNEEVLESESSEVPFIFPTQESNELEKSNSEEANSLLLIPTIYFYEILAEKKHSMWGILNFGQFTKL